MTALVPVSDLQTMAVAFAKSALFGAKSPEQCMALLLLAQAEGQHPAIAMRDFDVIQGRPAKKSEAMLRSFLAAGGVVEWHEMSDTKADASFMHPQGSNGKPVRIAWDLERAKKAGIASKDNWQKYGRAMLASRVISEGCRRVYPASTSGMYEPGEVRAIVQQERNMGRAEIVTDDPQPEKSAAQPGGSMASSYPPASGGGAPPAAAADPAPDNGPREQMLRSMCDQAGVKLADLLAKAGVELVADLSPSDFADAVEMLERKIAKKAGRG